MSSPLPKVHPRGPESAAAKASGSPTQGTPSEKPAAAVAAARGPSSTSKSPGRFSNKSGSPSAALDGSLLVDGMSRSPVHGGGCTSVFRSSTTTADAHIKALSSHYVKRPLSGSGGVLTPRGGTAAFRSTSPSDRDAHIKDLSNRAYATGGRSSSPNGSPNRHELPSAAFRSHSPIACAHILAMTKPTNASYSPSAGAGSRAATSWTRSTTSIADAHIKAMVKPHEGFVGLLSPTGGNGATNVFRSTTSIADAHIKAMTKPVDVVVSYRDIQDI